MKTDAIVIGAGLAGTEASLQLAKRGIKVKLFEMRPHVSTPAHETPYAGEMVCSNSLGATDIKSAAGLLKKELEILGSEFMKIADRHRVPAGNSYSVDRLELAREIDEVLANNRKIELIREEVTTLPESEIPVIIASGPLTSPKLSESLTAFTMRKNLFFYDATSPIIRADSIDRDKVFFASRYDKGEADFINIPLNEEQYNVFVQNLLDAEKVELKEFEKNIFFDACLPVEEIARRGFRSLAFGPLKPVGLFNPLTGKMPFAVIQLRQDDKNRSFYQMVGFQTRLKWGEQKRIFRTLPGLEKAEFERFGRMHRNSYINAPVLINRKFQSLRNHNMFFAGQISGVEGYVESVASGLAAGTFAAALIEKKDIFPLPDSTACGSLASYISEADWQNFRPTKFTFGLLPEKPREGIIKKLSKKEKKEAKAGQALEDLRQWIQQANF